AAHDSSWAMLFVATLCHFFTRGTLWRARTGSKRQPRAAAERISGGTSVPCCVRGSGTISDPRGVGGRSRPEFGEAPLRRPSAFCLVCGSLSDQRRPMPLRSRQKDLTCRLLPESSAI